MKKMALCALVFCGCVSAQAASSPGYTLSIAGHTARVELALTNEERSRGLMFRESLDADAGMLFVFDRPGRYSFWMRNTLIPLSIAFINRDGIIVNIEEMEPLSETPVSPRGIVLYVLEMNAGWFARKEIQPGMRVVFDGEIQEKLKKERLNL